MIVGSGIPTFFKLIIAVVVVSVLTLTGLGIVLNHRFCEERANSRDDGRAIWVYLVARDPERRDDPDVVEFVEFLDSRLPPLECSWWGAPQTKGSVAWNAWLS